jgi:hypothetical protein
MGRLEVKDSVEHFFWESLHSTEQKKRARPVF